MKNSDKQKFLCKYKHEIVMMFIISAFYLTLCFVYGVELCDDSKGYINMISAREPVYPLFLALFRSIFGKKLYLNVVIFVQNILMIYSVWNLICYLKKRFCLKPFMGYLMILINAGVACLCQFVALRGSAYSNSIETEALAIPLWLIFITCLFKAIDTTRTKYIWIMALLSALMMDVRKQMAIGFIVMFATLFIVYIGKKHYLRKMLMTVLSIVFSLFLALIVTRIYNLCLHGSFSQNTRDMNLVLTTSLYVADIEDADLIEEEDTRILFERTMQILEDKELTYKYAGKSLSELNAHYNECFDKITIDTTAYMFTDYAEERGFAKGMEAEAEADRMSKVIVSSLFFDNLGSYARVYISSIYDGLINTVAKRSHILDLYAMIMYLIYIALMILCLAKKRTRLVGFVSLAVLFSILINVGATAAFIFCQTRYMIYNMALFYMMGLLMLYAIIFKNESLGNEKKREIKKVMLIGPVYPYKGGIAHYTCLMSRAFSEKYEVSTVSYKMQYPKFMFKKEQRDYSNKTFEIEDAQFIINTANPFNWISSASKIRKMNPDLIICQWWHPYFSPCYQWIMGSLPDFKKLYICHNVLPHERFPMDKWLSKGTLSYGDYAIVHSKQDEEDLKHILPKMKYKRNVHPTYQAFKLRDISREQAREELGIEKSAKMILFFGLVRKYKGLIHLLNALPMVCKEYSDLKLYIVGDFAGAKEEYEKIIDELNIRDNIVIRDGYVPDEEVEPYFAAADLNICPYESATQSGIIQIAYGFNLPVIATNVGGLPEVVTDGKTGYVVESQNPKALADAIIKFYKENKQEEFRQAVLAEKERFSWERMVQVIEELTD